MGKSWLKPERANSNRFRSMAAVDADFGRGMRRRESLEGDDGRKKRRGMGMWVHCSSRLNLRSSDIRVRVLFYRRPYR